VYARLAALDLDRLARDKYARAAIRLREAAHGPVDPTPPHLESADLELPDVWIDDLLEWESAGDAAEACADVLLDAREPADSVARRMALVARLNALALRDAPPERLTDGRVSLARWLGEVELYVAVPPLERLASDDAPAVRHAAVHALGRCAYKRTIITEERALADPDDAVRKEAIAVIERLRFEHALDPLQRIFRTAASRDAHLAALRAIARIDVDDAARVALDALVYGADDERGAAADALGRSRGARFNAIAKEALRTVPFEARTRIESVLIKRGVPRSDERRAGR
jgi:HEAT repeat protein